MSNVIERAEHAIESVSSVTTEDGYPYHECVEAVEAMRELLAIVRKLPVDAEGNPVVPDEELDNDDDNLRDWRREQEAVADAAREASK